MAAAPPELWTPADFAAYAKLSLDQVAKLRSKGTGPAFTKVGKHVRYIPGVCHRWITENQQISTKDTPKNA